VGHFRTVRHYQRLGPADAAHRQRHLGVPAAVQLNPQR
jgi:hypothetical protein